MNIFNYDFNGQDSMNLDATSPNAITDPFNNIISSLLLKTIFKQNNKKIIPISSLKVDSDGYRIYYNDGHDTLLRNANSINDCPIFLISLYCFYNYHLLFDEEEDENGYISEIPPKEGIELNIDLNQIQGEIHLINEHKDNNIVSNHKIFEDKLRFEIDLLSDEIQADEILFPWISLIKESQPNKTRSLNFNELRVIDNLIFMSKNLLQDLIYLKLIEDDNSKVGLKSFLQQFESFYMNEFIQKLLQLNKQKLVELQELELENIKLAVLDEKSCVPEVGTTKSEEKEGQHEDVDTNNDKDTNSMLMISNDMNDDIEDADNEDNLSAEPEIEPKIGLINETNIPQLNSTNNIAADNSFQQLILRELNIIKQTMAQEFQNIKFQYSLQQQHLIRLEQQIQLQTSTQQQTTNPLNSGNNNFITSAKFSPFVNNSPSLNHILANNSSNNTNTTLQMLKNATQQQYQQQSQAFNPIVSKSNVNSPGGLALLSKIASPQPPMATNAITSMIPHSSAANIQQQHQSNLNDKLPPLHESVKMQQTFSEIISDLSNPTPTTMKKSASQMHPGNMQNKKRKLNSNTTENNTNSNGLQLDINSMIQMGIEEPSSNQQAASTATTAATNKNNSNNIVEIGNKADIDEDAHPQSNLHHNDVTSSAVISKNNGNGGTTNFTKKETKKGSASESIKYRIFRGHKTIFDVCEEWYVGLPRQKAMGATPSSSSNDANNTIDNDNNGQSDMDSNSSGNGKINNYNNKYLFAVVSKADSDAKSNAIIQRCNNTRDKVSRLESIQELIKQYGWRRWKVTGDSHFFPKRRVVIDYIEDETNIGFKNGRFNVHLDTLENCRKFVIWDLEQFRILNEMSLNNISILLKNVKKLNSKRIMNGVKKEEVEGPGEDDYIALRKELFGENEDSFSIYSNSGAVAVGDEVVMAVDGFKPIRKMGPDFINKFCKVNLFCKS